jgi:choline dehydrogenase
MLPRHELGIRVRRCRRGIGRCVLAARLSEDQNSGVLLLEAGGPDRAPEIRMPAGFPKLFKSAFDWNPGTEPQAHLAGRAGQWRAGERR